ncbi:VOC family protein [Mycobacterium paraseoulense]|uniref:Hydroxylase n=1 Tax=Mycobacterium paraseoulense TaxID=590652 RepID=A0A1X0IC55_9MYCO|nr:VOC family protein [Mycobacterium paraseoulense]MCV7393412.1 VOC family protein [Mycobacterium paraseoulense]ORB42967.1 hydroxylase [Mycobacterium paraseoulense]BBZ69510.1 hydroxylase [Mycobacterium paraseoulense]
MGVRTGYAEGTFSWVDLATSDPEAATVFYGTLFGWTPDERRMSDGRAYTVLRREQQDVAGLYALHATDPGGGEPRWNSHVSVADVDAAAARARSLGGTVLAGPLDVGDRGRLVVVRDPHGAVIHLCQPGRHFGATCVNETGCLTWNELATLDVDAAIAFYSRLFGWRIEFLAGMPVPYWVIRVGAPAVPVLSGDNGGLRGLTAADAGVPSRWLPYFVVADVAEAGAVAIAGGGAVLAGPTEQPKGRFSFLRDPQGASFLVFESSKLDP